MVKVRIRDYDPDEALPMLDVEGLEEESYIELEDRIYDAEQPDDIEDHEYNMILHTDFGKIRVNGIDFEFVDEGAVNHV